MKIKKNDTVKVISGKEKGKEGKVLKVSIEEKRLAVEGINIVKKHVKAKKDEKGGIIEFEKTIDLSNVMLVCPKCKKTTRVAFKIDGDKKVRLCKKCGEIIE